MKTAEVLRPYWLWLRRYTFHGSGERRARRASRRHSVCPTSLARRSNACDRLSEVSCTRETRSVVCNTCPLALRLRRSSSTLRDESCCERTDLSRVTTLSAPARAYVQLGVTSSDRGGPARSCPESSHSLWREDKDHNPALPRTRRRRGPCSVSLPGNSNES